MGYGPNIEQIIEEGIKYLVKDLIHLQTASEVEHQLIQAVNDKKGFSGIRLGDVVLLGLARDI